MIEAPRLIVTSKHIEGLPGCIGWELVAATSAEVQDEITRLMFDSATIEGHFGHPIRMWSGPEGKQTKFWKAVGITHVRELQDEELVR